MYDSSTSREMGYYQYHRHTTSDSGEFTISRDLPILYRHSRGYKRRCQESRVPEKLADFIADGEIIGISVIFENVIAPSWRNLKDVSYY